MSEQEKSIIAATNRLDFCIERMLQIPEVSRLFLQAMVDQYGTELSCGVDELNDAEVYKTIREILENQNEPTQTDRSE